MAIMIIIIAMGGVVFKNSVHLGHFCLRITQDVNSFNAMF